MKYYSEILRKNFDSVKELEVAEKAELKKQEEEKAEVEQASNEKKAMAKKVEEAEEAVREAYNKYDLARDDVQKIIAEANLEIKELLEPAKQAIIDAEKAKYEAVAEFNKKFGKYSVIYTGDKAFQEMKRAQKYMENLFNSIWF